MQLFNLRILHIVGPVRFIVLLINLMCDFNSLLFALRFSHMVKKYSFKILQIMQLVNVTFIYNYSFILRLLPYTKHFAIALGRHLMFNWEQLH